MTRDECVELGYIAKAHGIRGEVKATLDVQEVSAYKMVKHLYLAKKNEPLVPWKVTSFSIHPPNQAIIRFASVEDRNKAETLKGNTVYFPISSLPDLGPENFYYFEIIGFEVQDQEKGEIGTVTAILDQPGNDLLVVDSGGKEVLIPTHPDVLLKVDKSTQKIVVNLPEGLLELYLSEG